MHSQTRETRIARAKLHDGDNYSTASASRVPRVPARARSLIAVGREIARRRSLVPIAKTFRGTSRRVDCATSNERVVTAKRDPRREPLIDRDFP